MFEIHDAGPADVDHLAAFQLAMARETENLELDLERVRRGIAAMLEDPAKGNYYVARRDGHPVACLMLTLEWSEWRCGHVVWIQSVFVQPEYRRQGAFAQLYEHVRRQVERRPEWVGLRLYVEANNRRAQDVYQRLGMRGGHYEVYEWFPANSD